LFEPIHGSYPQAAGKDIANPLGSVLSAAMMLDYLKLPAEAKLVRDAAQWTIENMFVTKDIDPVNFYFTSTVGELICEYIQGRVSGVFSQENVELRKSTII
jgi:3-isopropylmalate dehydrogenase